MTETATKTENKVKTENRVKTAKESTLKTENKAGKSIESRRLSEHRRSNTAQKTGKNSEAAARTGRRNNGRRQGRAARGNRQPIVESFRHAFDGIVTGVEERNMKIHFGFAALVVIFGLLLKISVTEWCLCFVLFGLIMGLELVNTAIEAVVDLVTEEYKPLAKRAKDTAAGAVLIAAIMAAITGLIIFIPRFLYFLRIV